MKQYLIITMLLLAFTAPLISCTSDEPLLPPETGQPTPPGTNDNISDNTDNNENNTNDNNIPMHNILNISVASTTFTATLKDNAAAAAFKALLPLTINMTEMNNNEKYHYLPDALPTASVNPGTIRTGDLMLYGSTCLVLFYKTFSTSYAYTPLGRIDNPDGLAAALGSGNTTVTFRLE